MAFRRVVAVGSLLTLKPPLLYSKQRLQAERVVDRAVAVAE